MKLNDYYGLYYNLGGGVGLFGGFKPNVKPPFLPQPSATGVGATIPLLPWIHPDALPNWGNKK